MMRALPKIACHHKIEGKEGYPPAGEARINKPLVFVVLDRISNDLQLINSQTVASLNY